MPAIKLSLSKPADWTKAAKAEGIKGAQLASALKAAEKALGDEKKKKDNAEAIQACVAAVKETAEAVAQTIKKELDAKKNKDLVASLKKLDAECQSEVKRLESALADADAADDDDDDVSDADLASLKQLKLCLKKAKTKSNALDGVSFCFAVAKKPEDCKLVMHKKKNFSLQLWKRFEKICREDDKLKAAGLKKSRLAHGTCYRHQEDGTVLVLQLHVKSKSDIPGMDLKSTKWMLKNKTDLAPFKKLEFVDASGKPIQSPPDTEDDAENAREDAAEQQAESAPAEVQPGEGQGETQEVRPGEDQGENQDVQPGENQPETQEVRPGENQGETQQAPVEDEAAIEDRRKEFKKMRRQWQTVKEKAIQDLEAVKDGIRDYYLDDPEQFKIATSKLGELDAIMDNLNDDLRDVLNQYVSLPKSRATERDRLGSQATDIVQRFLNYASSDRLLNAVDQKEFADVQVKAPIEKALKDLVKTLA